MTKKTAKDYFTGAQTAPYDTAPAGETLSWNPQVSPEAALERQALTFGLDNRPPVPDMYSQAVALDGREPAAVAYEPPPQSALNPSLYPAPGVQREEPLMIINRGAGQGEYPTRATGAINRNLPEGYEMTNMAQPVVIGTQPFGNNRVVHSSDGSPVTSGSKDWMIPYNEQTKQYLFDSAETYRVPGQGAARTHSTPYQSGGGKGGAGGK